MFKRKLKPCPNCGKSGKSLIFYRTVVSGSIFDGHLWHVECPSCHWCGKLKLFRWRAIMAWNKSHKK